MFFTNSSNQIQAQSDAIALNETMLERIGAVSVAQGTTTTTTVLPTEPSPTEKPFPERDVGVVIGAVFGWICVVAGLVYLWKQHSNRRSAARAAAAKGVDVENTLAQEQSMVHREDSASTYISSSSHAGGGDNASVKLEEPILHNNINSNNNNNAGTFAMQLAAAGGGGTSGGTAPQHYRQLDGSRSNNTKTKEEEEDDGSSVL